MKMMIMIWSYNDGVCIKHDKERDQLENLVGKPVGERLLGIQRRRGVNNIKDNAKHLQS
jgi:hypothetical protein